MKQIIDGKIYNTETATYIGNDYGGDGFSSYDESLYKTPRGRYFLAGEGGPMTKYAESAGQNSWRGSKKIIVLSEEEAREWAEKHMDTDEYLKFFKAEEA